MTDSPNSAKSAPSAVWASGRKRSGGTTQIPDDTVAAYGAARAFLLGEWFGGSLMVASFALLYMFGLSPRGGNIEWGIIACLVLLAAGTFVYWRSRAYYLRVGFDYAPKWHRVTIILAGSAGIFWLLFAFLLVLTWFGIPVLPNK